MLFEENNKAIYIQIADRICDQIISGIYPPGTRLPSVREYAADVQVNANTVMRSYDRLASCGYIYNKRGIGFFISNDAKDNILKKRGEDLMNSKLNDIFSLLRQLQISPEELQDAYRRYLEDV